MGRENARFVLKNKKTDILLFIQSVFSYLVLGGAIYLLLSTTINLNQLQNNIKTMYKLSDNFFGEVEQSFFAQHNNLEILVEFYDWLDDNNDFDYLVASNQAFYIEDQIFPERFKVGYDFGHIFIESEYKSIQVNNNFIQYFNIDIIDGRVFNFEDYNMNNEIIPVILGYDFRDYISIGDKFDFYYCNKDLIAEVIGFLNDGVYYSNGNNLIELNSFILMPAMQIDFSYLGANEIDRFFALKVYLDNMSGFIVSDLPIYDVQRMITNKSLEFNIVPYSILGAFPFYLAMWGMEGESLQGMFVFISIFMIIVSSFFISISVYYKIQNNIKPIAVFILNGVSRRNIFKSIYLYIFFINFFGFFVSGLFWVFISSRILLLILFLVVVLSSLIQSIYPYLLIKTFNVTKSISKGE